MSKPRVLIFASYFAPNSFSEALVNNKFAMALQNAGWDITIITTSDYFGDKYENEWSELWEKLKLVTHNIPTIIPNDKGKLFKRLKALAYLNHPINGINWAFKAYRLAMQLHKERPFDLIISRSISDHGHLPALKFKKATGIKWVANWNDPPYFIFPPPYEIKSKIVSRFLYKRYLKDVAKRADINTFPSLRLYNYIQAKLKLFSPTGNKILPHLNTSLKVNTKNKSKDIFKICHAGNLSKERSPELFLAALKRMTQKHPNIICYIIGTENVDLKSKIEEFNLVSYITFTGAISYKETLEFLTSCNIGLLIEAQCDEGIFLPSKVSDYIYANLPILSISPKEGTLNDLINDYGGGILVDNTREGDIYKGLESLYLNWKDNLLEDYPTQKLQEYYSDKVVIDFLKKCLD
ncbi:glycosyltransferase [Carboxylicivirga taeanensis]|uniref:glycosyltransferase n=1 Tax=Carboxylicivirga taeanensis TaxID=1416875 RepID=UPI003F6DED77